MNVSKQSRVALICGGSSGIGLATLQLLSKECHVYNLDIQAPRCEVTNSTYINCDLSDPNQIKQSFEFLSSLNVTVTQLFYSAGIVHNNYIEDTLETDYKRIMDINVKGIYYVLQNLLPSMKENRCGTILLMASEQSIIGRPKNPIYAMSKAAIAQMARSLAIDNGPYGIRINAISPGTTMTPMYINAVATSSAKSGMNPHDIYKEDANTIPLGRLASPEEVAKAAFFLLSDQSSYITGINLVVDGGFTIS